MIELTEEQQRELANGQLPKVHDPRTDETYVLVRADVYERMRAIIDARPNVPVGTIRPWTITKDIGFLGVRIVNCSLFVLHCSFLLCS